MDPTEPRRGTRRGPLRLLRSWWSSVAPWSPALPGWLAFYALFGYVVATSPATDRERIRPVELAIMGAGLAVYALSRIHRSHPLCDRTYLEWLKTTPWEPGRRLPFSPILLREHDVIVVGAAVALSRASGLFGVDDVILCFAGVYLAGLMSVIAYAGRLDFALAVSAGLALVVGAWGWWGVAAAAPVYVLASLGVRRSLAEFPWENDRARFRIFVPDAGKDRSERLLGWPLANLGPGSRSPRMPVGVGVGIALVTGVWIGVLNLIIRSDENLTLAPIVAAIVAAVRVGVYCAGRSSPLGIAGRLRLGRIIVPGYDVVFVAPIAAIAVSILGAGWSSTPLAPVADGLATAAAMLILLVAPPSLDAWRLTGAHDSRSPQLRQVGGARHAAPQHLTSGSSGGHRAAPPWGG